MATKRQRTTRGLIKNLNEQIPQWKIDFLLSGQRAEKLDTFEKVVFIGARPGDFPGRWGKIEPWFELWERIKGESFIKEFQKQHGRTFAEKLLAR